MLNSNNANFPVAIMLSEEPPICNMRINSILRKAKCLGVAEFPYT